jgi:hypothetical protein
VSGQVYLGFITSIQIQFLKTLYYEEISKLNLIIYRGSAVAQAVSRWFPTAAAWFRFRAACGFCGGQSGIGACFLRVLRFPLPIIPPISPSS